MNDTLSMDSLSLQSSIQEQEQTILQLQQKIEKIRQTIKYKKEHLLRLEKKNEALFDEKNQLLTTKKALSRELELLSNSDEQIIRIQSEIDNAVMTK